MNAVYQKHREFMLNDSAWPSCHSHLHTHCEIMYVAAGVLSAKLDGVSYEIHEHEAMFILPHQIHSFESTQYNEGYVMFVSPLLLPKHADLMKTNILENPIIRLDKKSTVNLCDSIVEYIYECFPGKPDVENGMRRSADGEKAMNSDFAKSLIESYVSLLLEGSVWKKKTVSAMDTARKVLEYCLSNYREDISLYKVANAIGVTEHTVTRVFTDILHCNFRKYINFLRLSDVTRLLTETNEPITEIAQKCGFDTLRTFNRVFMSEYSDTPSEFRKKRNKHTNN